MPADKVMAYEGLFHYDNFTVLWYRYVAYTVL